jgi:hypothetical protein
MSSYRRLALLLALLVPAVYVVQAQSSSSTSDSQAPAQETPAPQQPSAQPQTQPQPQAPVSVQARIKARREARRVQAMHDIYAHLYEVYVGAGYLRFTPGPALQRVNEYEWNVGLTRYFSERLGLTIDGRGLYGTPFVGLNSSPITKPAISEYTAMAGPTYRFYMQPRYSVSGRVMGGYAAGNFSGDTNGFGTAFLGLYPDGNAFAVSASVIGEYNLSPALGLRLAPEYVATAFGSSLQSNLGFTAGIVYRFGKQ